MSRFPQPYALLGEDGTDVIVEPWSIEKGLYSDTCLMHVSKANDYENGIWRCNLQSFPVNGNYLPAGKNIEVRLVKPPKVNKSPSKMGKFSRAVGYFSLWSH